MLHPCLGLFSILPPSTVLQPKAPGWPWESCAARLSSTPTAPHHPRLQPLQPSLCPNAVSCHHLLFLLCPFFPGALISCDSDTPNSPLFTGRDTVQTSAPLGASISNSGLPWDSGPAPHPAHWSECSPSLRAGSQSC